MSETHPELAPQRGREAALSRDRRDASAPPASAAKAIEGPTLRPSRDAYRPSTYEPSRLWRWIYARFFGQLPMDERWAEEVKSAASRGLVVYIARSLSFLDFLAIDFLSKRFGLPAVQFTNDMGMSIVEPFGRGSRRMRLAKQIPEDRALTDCIHAGATPLLFLRRSPRFAEAARRGRDMELDLVRTLVELQRKTAKPIILMPQTLVWTKRPPSSRASIVDLLFGPAEWPGRIRTFLQFLLNYRNALHRGGEPFDLSAFLEEHQDLTDAQAADAIRYLLLRRMERERTTVLGPAKKPVTRIRDELLRSPRLRRAMEQSARESNKPLAEIERSTRRELERLCAAMDVAMVGLLHRVVDRIWNRIYDGIELDMEGLARMRAAARKGPLVLLPSHKSHVDYLVLSDVLYINGIAPPLIAAGDNLSFFPLGPILRRAGAFFIRRSFKGRKLYPQIVDAYVRKILVEGWNVELFVEGGRSRTGKLLPPKLGILSMIVDAALKLSDREIHFVPISIGYERIIEERSYVHELAGGEKQPESMAGLLSSSRVLRSKYGRLYLTFGEPMSFQRLKREAAGLELDAPEGAAEDPIRLTPTQRRAMVQRIAHRVTYEINRVTVVTPAALAATVLMAHRRRGIAHSDLVAQAERMVKVFTRMGARIARPVVDEAGKFRPEAVLEAIGLFSDARLVVTANDAGGQKRRDPTLSEPIYAVPEDRRLALEYHKNAVLHFFVPSALLASSLAALGWETDEATLRERVQRISRIFKYEFQYRADAEFDAIFKDALDDMIASGEIVRADGGATLRRAGGEAGRRLDAYAEMLRTYFESYRLALRAAKPLDDHGRLKKDWLKSTLAAGRRAYLAGEIQLEESIARPKLENAILWMHDQALVRSEGDTIKRGATLADAEQVSGLERTLEDHLR